MSAIRFALISPVGSDAGPQSDGRFDSASGSRMTTACPVPSALASAAIQAWYSASDCAPPAEYCEQSRSGTS